MERNGLHVGDELRFEVSGTTYTYRIAVQTRDIMYGNEMSGMGRFLFCKADYDKMVSDSENVKIVVYGFNTLDPEKTLRRSTSRTSHCWSISLNGASIRCCMCLT